MKLIETEIPKSYTLYDNNNGHVVGTWDDLYDLYHEGRAYVRRTHYAEMDDILTTHSGVVIRVTRIRERDLFLGNRALKNMYVENERGEVIDFDAEWKATKPAYKYKWNSNHNLYRENRDDMIREGLVLRKDNKNKIKRSYNAKVYWSNYEDREGYYCTAHSIAHMQTQGEHRKIAGVIKEEGEPEFRGKRRNIPQLWDDKRVGVHYNYKSWKHNSKRSKQWKVKDGNHGT